MRKNKQNSPPSAAGDASRPEDAPLHLFPRDLRVDPVGSRRQGAWFIYTLWEYIPFAKAGPDIKYHVRGSVEHCPETGRPHLHGVATLWKKTTAREAFRILGLPQDRAWISCMTAGDSRVAVAYAKKTPETPGVPICEDGVFVVESGQRTDIEGACHILQEKGKKGMEEVKKDYPTVYVKYSTGLEKLVSGPPENKEIVGRRTFLISGPTAVGKTTWVRQNFPDLYVFTNNGSNRGKWWNGYTGQEVVLIDEYEGGWDGPFIKQLTDKWPCPVETKGGTSVITARLIFFISNLDYTQCFGSDPAIARRVECVIWMARGNIPQPLRELIGLQPITPAGSK